MLLDQHFVSKLKDALYGLRRFLKALQILLIIPFFVHAPKCQDKNLNILRMGRAFKMKRKVFLIIFEGLSLSQIKKSSLEGQSPTLSVAGGGFI